MAILNGQYVAASEINPALHKYIGMFRPAECPRCTPGTGVFICPNNHHSFNVGEEMICYLQGCFDQPQYVDIWPGQHIKLGEIQCVTKP